MRYFAEVIGGIVQRVIVVEPEMLATGLWGDPANWVETHTDGAARFNYAGIGYHYDSALDAFYCPSPYPSWVLNENVCCWEAPIPMPENGVWVWNEELLAWIEFVSP